MNWQDFYLVCFLVGFGLSALALLAGSVHLHLPHLHIHHGIHVPHSAEVMKGSAQMPWFNFGTVAAFLAWFGGTGYLVDDPEGYQNELISDVGALEDKLDLWLVSGAERFRRDPELHHALLAVARHSDSRLCLILLGEILENPGLAERLMEVLKPTPGTTGRHDGRRK